MFVRLAEQLYDKKFQYDREYKDSYNYRLGKLGLGVQVVTNPKSVVGLIVKRALIESIQNNTLQKSLNMGVTNPKHIPKKTLEQIEKKAVQAVLKAFDKGAYTKPVSAGVNIAKKAIIQAGKYISKSASI